MRIEKVSFGNGVILKGKTNSYQITQQSQSNQTREINLNASPLNAPYLVKFAGWHESDAGKIQKNEKEKYLYIDNVFEAQRSQIADKDPALNPDGLKVKVITAKGNKKKIFITNGKDKVIAKVSVDMDVPNLPKIKYYQGKFDPTLELTTTGMNDENMRVKMFAGSRMKGNQWSVVMPGKTMVEKRGVMKDVSFGYRDESAYMPTGGGFFEDTKKTNEPEIPQSREVKNAQVKKPDIQGKVFVTTCNLESNVYESTHSYLDADVSSVNPGKLGSLASEMGVSLIYPAGGFGTRFYCMNDGIENKVSTNLPTDPTHRIMHTAMYAGLKGGFFDGNEDVTYLSETGNSSFNNKQNVVNTHKETDKGGTDGLSIKRGILDGVIPANKPALVVNADGISNYYLPYILKYYQELGDAAAIIPYTVVPDKEAKAFGLIGIKPTVGHDVSLKNGEGVYEIAHFAEKPKFLKESEIPTIHDVKPKKPALDAPNYEAAMEKYNVKLEKFNKDNADVLKGIEEYQKSMSARYKDSPDAFYVNPGVYLFSPEALKVLCDSEDKKTGLGGSLMPKLVDMAKKGELKDKDGRELKVYTVPMLRIDQQEAKWNDVGSVQAYMKEVKNIAHQTSKHGISKENPYFGLPEYMLNDFAKNADLQTGVIYMSENAKEQFDDWTSKTGVIARGNVLVTDLPVKNK